MIRTDEALPNRLHHKADTRAAIGKEAGHPPGPIHHSAVFSGPLPSSGRQPQCPSFVSKDEAPVDCGEYRGERRVA